MQPSCSIVIPTRERLPQLRRCLEAIASCDYPAHRMEIIIVDDSSSGSTHLNESLSTLPRHLHVSVRKTPGIGPAGARNLGAQAAGGDILAFTDDDCRVDAAWLRTLTAALASSPIVAAGGYTVNNLRNNRWSAASQRIIDLVYAYYNADPHHATFLTTNNLAVHKQGFHEVGGFNERYRTAEDRDFCRRWLAAKNQMVFVPDALVYHEHELTFSGFLRQQFGYGRGAYQFLRDGVPQGQIHVVKNFYASMPRLISSLSGQNGAAATPRFRLLGELALWQAANLAGFAWQAARSSLRTTSLQRKQETRRPKEPSIGRMNTKP